MVLDASMPSASDFTQGWFLVPPTSYDPDHGICEEGLDANLYLATTHAEFVLALPTVPPDATKIPSHLTASVFVRAILLRPGTGPTFVADWRTAEQACKPKLGQSGASVTSHELSGVGEAAVAFDISGGGAENYIEIAIQGDYAVKVEEQVLAGGSADQTMVQSIASGMIRKLPHN